MVRDGRWHTGCFLAALAVCLFTTPLHAQRQPWEQLISGVVKDSTDRPIRGALVWVPGTPFATHTNHYGEFLFDTLPEGSLSLHADGGISPGPARQCANRARSSPASRIRASARPRSKPGAALDPRRDHFEWLFRRGNSAGNRHRTRPSSTSVGDSRLPHRVSQKSMEICRVHLSPEWASCHPGSQRVGAPPSKLLAGRFHRRRADPGARLAAGVAHPAQHPH